MNGKGNGRMDGWTMISERGSGIREEGRDVA